MVQPPAFRLARVLGGEGSEAHRFEQALRGLAVTHEPQDEDAGPPDAIYAVGDSHVAVLDLEGRLLRRWATERPPYSVAVDPAGGRLAAAHGPTVWVGEAGQIEIFSPAGERIDVWRDDLHLGLVTAIGFTADGVLAADATARCIRHYDRQGSLRNAIGEKHRKGGFHIPNGVVDFAVDSEGIVHVANPGMHRVERYTPEGELLGHFGRFGGGDPERFPLRGTDVTFSGCCNPTNLTLAGDRVVVSEKAPPRAKVYDSAGRLLAMVATAEAFDPGAKNMDVAADGRGVVYVADPVRRRICVFEPVASGEVKS